MSLTLESLILQCQKCIYIYNFSLRDYNVIFVIVIFTHDMYFLYMQFLTAQQRGFLANNFLLNLPNALRKAQLVINIFFLQFRYSFSDYIWRRIGRSRRFSLLFRSLFVMQCCRTRQNYKQKIIHLTILLALIRYVHYNRTELRYNLKLGYG